MARKRICIMGNSHVAAWKHGLSRTSALADRFDIDFFAAHSDHMRAMELRGRVLVPTAPSTRNQMSRVSGGLAEIDTDRYAHFVLVGLRFNLARIVEPLQRFRIHGFEWPAVADCPYLSRPAFAELVHGVLAHSTALYFARLLRQAGRESIVLVPQPYPSEEVLQYEFWGEMHSSGLLGHAIEVYLAKARELAADAGCTLLLQPERTIGANGLTLAACSVAAPRLHQATGAERYNADASHMNGEFGAEMLAACSAALPD